MGRTTLTVRQSMEIIAKRYEKMKQVMRKEDIDAFEKLLIMGRQHSPEISYGSIDPELGFIISALIEIMKRLENASEESKRDPFA